MRRHPLAAAIVALLLPSAALAQALDPAHDRERAKQLEELVVTASPLGQLADEIARPVDVLSGAELDAAKGATLGETLSGLPGVQSGYFGPGVGRPIIRGLDGPRVQVLANGISALDASTISVDHAVSIEPFLADQIEVLKGPATLLYGSSAIGGAVNVVDGRIPEMLPPDGFSGRAEMRGNTVSDERTGMLRLDGGGSNVAWHFDALRRRADDVRIPGHAESAEQLAEEGELPDEDAFGILENSAVDTDSASFGLSWIGSRGFIGASYTMFDTLYGIPGHAHHHDEGHDDEHDHDHDDDHGHDEEEEEAVTIDLRQRRTDVRGQLDQPFAGHDSLRFRLGHSDYRHVELEGDEIGTMFDTNGLEGRIEAVHLPLAGWRGAWGVQYGRRDFRAVGEEAFVPPSLTRDRGLFWLLQRDFDRHSVELGARGDRVTVDPEGADGRRFSTASASMASRFAVSDDLHLQLGLDRSERAPTAEELFSDGPHIATRTFEVGDASLDTEIANRIELGLHWHTDRIDASAAIYHTRFDDFIYLAGTDEEEDELPVGQWTQGDARFNGIEAQAKLLLAETAWGDFSLKMFGDHVRARVDEGGNLPRIPATRLGADFGWQDDAWRATLGAVRHGRQDRVAEFERESDGYTLLNAHVAYHWDVNDIGWELFLDATNLTDREARPHTSFLRDVAPLPGRGLAFGIRAFF